MKLFVRFVVVVDKGRSQQCISPAEEKAFVGFTLNMSALGRSVQIKHLPYIAFSATSERSAADRL